MKERGAIYCQRKCELYKVLSHRLERKTFFSGGWEDCPWKESVLTDHTIFSERLWLPWTQNTQSCCMLDNIYFFFVYSAVSLLFLCFCVSSIENLLLKNTQNLAERVSQTQQWELCHMSKMWLQINNSLSVLSSFLALNRFPWPFITVEPVLLVWDLPVNKQRNADIHLFFIALVRRLTFANN